MHPVPRSVPTLAAAVLAILALPGCDATDPLLREGTWRASHAMDANIAAQVTRPSVLVRGVEYTPRDGATATAAVDRYRSGRIRTLPDISSGRIRDTPTGDTNSGAQSTGGTAGQGQ